MAELFRMEAESQTRLLSDSLLALERDLRSAEHLEASMRAAHSLKGAARLVGITAAVDIAHAMEDCFVAAQRGAIVLDGDQIDLLLEGADLLSRTADSAGTTAEQRQEAADRYVGTLTSRLAQTPGEVKGSPKSPASSVATVSAAISPPAAELQPDLPITLPEDRRVLRVTADNFDRLLGLAGESLVEARKLKPHLASLLRLKRLHQDVAAALDGFRDALRGSASGGPIQSAWTNVSTLLAECRDMLTERMAELEDFDSRSADLARRLYNEALACRMRPFADGIAGLPKMVRSLARSLGKQARLKVIGSATQVDRDVLESLEAPLAHLLRNAVDHGIEMPSARLDAGKPTEGVIRLEASHSAGMLQVIVADDGGGVPLGRLRELIVERKLAQRHVADALSDTELLEFLFLPSFTMKSAVTEISGRGVGLDAVRTMVRQVHGTVRVTSQPGQGTQFELRLPLTLSVVRTLQAEVGGEAYAFPLSQIRRAVKLPRSDIVLVESKPHMRDAGELVGLVSAAQLLGGPPPPDQEMLSVILITEFGAAYGLIVDRFLGERDTVVQPLDSRFGKVADIIAGGTTEGGAPLLIVDVGDMLRSVEKLVTDGSLLALPQNASPAGQRARKRVLVVDDSLTVRELERKLLDHAGYVVETAVDGMEGWNVARSGRFDLVITDVDMPRLDGIELVRLIKQDAHLKMLPVMIVSYKDDEMDRRRGLDAGADYYLPKAGFHDETLLQSVMDLIGEPVS